MSERPDAQQARPDLYRTGDRAVSGADCAVVDDLAAAFVLSAVDPSERAFVDAHRERCQSCASLIADLKAPIDLLGASVHQVAPPTRTKAALFDKIAATPQAQPHVDAPFLQPPVAERPLTIPTLTIPSSRDAFAPDPGSWRAGGPDPMAPASARRSQRFRPNWQTIAAPLATVPLVLALGIVGFWAMNTQNRLSARSAEIQSLNSQVNTLSNRVETLNTVLADVDGFMQAPDAKRYDMTVASDHVDSDAVGMVIANPGTVEAIMVVKNLGARHSTYEIVLESADGLYTSVGEIPVTKDGDGKAVLQLDQPLANYTAVHVKPMMDYTGSGSTDLNLVAAPDALSGAISPNLGSIDDTDLPDVGQSG